jgi:hypothetical protein
MWIHQAWFALVLGLASAQPPTWCPTPGGIIEPPTPPGCPAEKPHYDDANAGDKLTPVEVLGGCPFTTTLNKDEALYFKINRTTPTQLFKHKVSIRTSASGSAGRVGMQQKNSVNACRANPHTPNQTMPATGARSRTC